MLLGDLSNRSSPPTTPTILRCIIASTIVSNPVVGSRACQLSHGSVGIHCSYTLTDMAFFERVLFLCLACVTSTVIQYVCADAENNSLEISIAQGRLRGHHLTSRKGREFAAFQGIPYVQAPVGELRFKTPQSHEGWTGVRDASKDGPVCIQRNVYFRQDFVEGEEDCLYLNVFTPQLPGDNTSPNFDVMVWIHGGGWFSGSGNIYKPNFLLDKDIVLVTFNYRLGPLGLLSIGDAVLPGNNAFKDQVAALRWVQDNIAAFGGNPKSVTIFGESAGGASSQYHMLSPMSKGLFHKAISQSGTALCPWSRPRSTVHHTHTLAKALECPTTSAELVACLRQKEASAIIETDKLFMEWDIDPMMPFRPVVETEVAEGEEAFIVEDPEKTLRDVGTSFAIPWINGLTSGEGAVKAALFYNDSSLLRDFNEEYDRVAPISMLWGETSPDVEEVNRRTREFYFADNAIDKNTVSGVVDLATDCYILHGADQAMRLQARHSSVPVYYYLFSYRGTSSFSSLFGDATKDYGVCHSDELQYLFPMVGTLFDAPMSAEDEKMVDILTTLWTDFAHTGNPTSMKTSLYPGVWEPVASADMEYLNIGPELLPGNGLFAERAHFWSTLPVYPNSEKYFKDEL